MQPTGMQLYATASQQNMIAPQNGFPIMLSNYNNVSSLPAQQQAALLMSQQQIHQQTAQQQQQQQYLALYLQQQQQQQQQQQRQMMINSQNYSYIYPMNKTTQINQCFNTPVSQSNLLMTPQQSGQISNMVYNLQPNYNYPMYVQPYIPQPAAQQVQIIPMTQARTDQNLNQAKPFDNLTNICQTMNNSISTTPLEKLSSAQKTSSQNLNFPQVFLNQNQIEASTSTAAATAINQNNCLDQMLTPASAEMLINKIASQNLLKDSFDINQAYNIIQKAYHMTMQNNTSTASSSCLSSPAQPTATNTLTLIANGNSVSNITQNCTNSDEQTSQISKSSSERATVIEKPRRGFRLSNNDSKTQQQFHQMSPQFSESPFENSGKEKFKNRNPPIISKPIKKMSKDGTFAEDRSDQNECLLLHPITIKVKKVDVQSLTLEESRSKSDTKVLLDNMLHSEEKEIDNIENTSQMQEDNLVEQIKENNNLELMESENLFNILKDVTNSKNDECAQIAKSFFVSLQKQQEVEKLGEINQEQTPKGDSTQMNSEPNQSKENTEEKETENANAHKSDQEMSENDDSVQDSKCESHDSYALEKEASCSNAHEHELEEEVEEEEESQKTNEKTPKKQKTKCTLQKQKKINKLQKKKPGRKPSHELKKKIQPVNKYKEDHFKCSSNIQLENVLPTKTRRGKQQHEDHKETEKDEPQKKVQQAQQPPQQQEQQSEYVNMDIFQEATQSIMNQFEKYNIKNLKKDDDLIEEFQKFMSNARKNDEYISQLLNPVECDFSDNFIEFLRGPALKWIKKTIEKSKQSVYYQLVNLFKSEDRGSSSLRPRRTRTGCNYQQK